MADPPNVNGEVDDHKYSSTAMFSGESGAALPELSSLVTENLDKANPCLNEESLLARESTIVGRTLAHVNDPSLTEALGLPSGTNANNPAVLFPSRSGERNRQGNSGEAMAGGECVEVGNHPPRSTSSHSSRPTARRGSRPTVGGEEQMGKSSHAPVGSPGTVFTAWSSPNTITNLDEAFGVHSGHHEEGSDSWAGVDSIRTERERTTSGGWNPDKQQAQTSGRQEVGEMDGSLQNGENNSNTKLKDGTICNNQEMDVARSGGNDPANLEPLVGVAVDLDSTWGPEPVARCPKKENGEADVGDEDEVDVDERLSRADASWTLSTYGGGLESLAKCMTGHSSTLGRSAEDFVSNKTGAGDKEPARMANDSVVNICGNVLPGQQPHPLLQRPGGIQGGEKMREPSIQMETPHGDDQERSAFPILEIIQDCDAGHVRPLHATLDNNVELISTGKQSNGQSGSAAIYLIPPLGCGQAHIVGKVVASANVPHREDHSVGLPTLEVSKQIGGGGGGGEVGEGAAVAVAIEHTPHSNGVSESSKSVVQTKQDNADGMYTSPDEKSQPSVEEDGTTKLSIASLVSPTVLTSSGGEMASESTTGEDGRINGDTINAPSSDEDDSSRGKLKDERNVDEKSSTQVTTTSPADTPRYDGDRPAAAPPSAPYSGGREQELRGEQAMQNFPSAQATPACSISDSWTMTRDGQHDIRQVVASTEGAVHGANVGTPVQSLAISSQSAAERKESVYKVTQPAAPIVIKSTIVHGKMVGSERSSASAPSLDVVAPVFIRLEKAMRRRQQGKASVVIQTCTRGLLARKRYEALLSRQNTRRREEEEAKRRAAIAIQAVLRGRQERRAMSLLRRISEASPTGGSIVTGKTLFIQKDGVTTADGVVTPRYPVQSLCEVGPMFAHHQQQEKYEVKEELRIPPSALTADKQEGYAALAESRELLERENESSSSSGNDGDQYSTGRDLSEQVSRDESMNNSATTTTSSLAVVRDKLLPKRSTSGASSSNSNSDTDENGQLFSRQHGDDTAHKEEERTGKRETDTTTEKNSSSGSGGRSNETEDSNVCKYSQRYLTTTSRGTGGDLVLVTRNTKNGNDCHFWVEENQHRLTTKEEHGAAAGVVESPRLAHDYLEDNGERTPSVRQPQNDAKQLAADEYYNCAEETDSFYSPKYGHGEAEADNVATTAAQQPSEFCQPEDGSAGIVQRLGRNFGERGETIQEYWHGEIDETDDGGDGGDLYPRDDDDYAGERIFSEAAGWSGGRNTLEGSKAYGAHQVYVEEGLAPATRSAGEA